MVSSYFMEKIVFITGVSRGIGKALAGKFLEGGYTVMGTSTTGKSPLKHTDLTLLKLDLSSSKSIERCVQDFVKLKKKIDILINNAGVVYEELNGPVEDIEIEMLRKTLEINLIGTIDFTQRMVSMMNGSGHIVNISSREGSLNQIKVYNDATYRISKVGLNMFTKLLAIRLKDKITVSCVHPGWVKTDMGGPNADIEPEEAAEDIFKLANSKVESGQFWFKGKKFPW